MSRENVQLIKQLYEAWNGSDRTRAMLPYLDPEVEWVNPEYAVEPGIRLGHDGFVAVMENLAAAFDRYYHEPQEFIVAGDKVLCLTTFRARGRDGRVEYSKSEQHVWTLRRGKVLRLEWFHDEDEALRAAGMRD